MFLKFNHQYSNFNKIQPGCLNLERIDEYESELMASGFGSTIRPIKRINLFGISTYEVLPQLSNNLKMAYFHEDKLVQKCSSYSICISSANGESAW